MTAIRLMFSSLAVASFAPIAMGLQPGWWAAYYYGALFVWWVLMSLVMVRLATPEDQRAERDIDQTAERDIGNAVTAGRHAQAPQALGDERLIIVARDLPDLYDRIRRNHSGDKAVRVITDRRSTDRRSRVEVYFPDRRRAERRCYDIAPLLFTQGWAQITLPKS